MMPWRARGRGANRHELSGATDAGDPGETIDSHQRTQGVAANRSFRVMHPSGTTRNMSPTERADHRSATLSTTLVQPTSTVAPLAGDVTASGHSGSNASIPRSTSGVPAVNPTEVPPPHAPTTRECLWCAREFLVERRPGRPRIYCRRSCRQRAYERRAGLGVVPPVDRRIMQPNPVLTRNTRGTVAYERGTVWSPDGKFHAMRPAAFTDHLGRRAALCGCLAVPRGIPFAPVHPNTCRTCAGVAELRPCGQPLAPSAQLAGLRAYLDLAAVWLSRRRAPTTPGERILGALTEAA